MLFKIGANFVTVILSLLIPKKRKKLQVQGFVKTQLRKQKRLLDRKNSAGKKSP